MKKIQLTIFLFLLISSCIAQIHTASNQTAPVKTESSTPVEGTTTPVSPTGSNEKPPPPTGNSAIDHMIEMVLKANPNNPQLISALTKAAAVVKSNPSKFINPDGSINVTGFYELLNQYYNSSNYKLPSVTSVQESLKKIRTVENTPKTNSKSKIAVKQ